MAKYTIHAAKTQFSKLLKKAASGEEVIILNRDKPVARLVAVKPAGIMSLYGDLKGKIKIGPDFDKIPEGFEDYT